MRTTRRLLTALLAAIALTVASAPLAHAGSVNPGVLSPGQKAFGKSYGAWSAAWWQYVVSRWLSVTPGKRLGAPGVGVVYPRSTPA